jgi:hypothetical protein
MSYYDEDFYHEPSEFDIQIENFKAILLDSVKEEYKIKMEQLEKENEELQSVKANFEGIKRDFENKKRQLENEYQTLRSNVRRERLSELMQDFQVELYTVASQGKTQPKCDKCDENRRIPYTTPSGRETYEQCDCSSRIHVYEPIPIILNEFSIRNGEGRAFYRVENNSSRNEYLDYYENSISGEELITSEEQFESIGYEYRTLFKDKEIAQKYCDYKNKQNKE